MEMIPIEISTPTKYQVIQITENRDVKRYPENRISVLDTKSGSTSSANKIQIYLFFFHFHQRNYIKIIKCQVKLIHTFV